jgi:hypothetical protein
MVDFRHCGVRISPGRGKGEFAHSETGGLKPRYSIFILIDDDAAAGDAFSGDSCRLKGDGRAVRPLTRLPPSGKNRISDAAAWDDAGEVGEAGEARVAGEDGDTDEEEGVGEDEEVGEGVGEVEYRVFSMVNGCMK